MGDEHKSLLDILDDLYFLDEPITLVESFYNKQPGSEVKLLLNEQYFNDFATFHPDINDFGSALRALREDIDCNTRDLAKKAGLSQSYISQLENNYNLPSDKSISKISKGLTQLAFYNYLLDISYYETDFVENGIHVPKELDRYLREELIYSYKELLSYYLDYDMGGYYYKGKKELEELNKKDKKTSSVPSDTPTFELNKQETQLIDSFRSMNAEARNLFVTMARQLAESQPYKDESNEETD